MPNLKNCKDCGHEISKSAKVCPNCGSKQGSSFFIKLIRFVIGIILIICGLGMIFSFDSNDVPTKEVSSIEKNYATMEKFEQIHEGMTYDEVVSIMGFDGTLSTESSALGSSMQIYYWYAENGFSNVTISFLDGKVNGKSQIGL